MLVSFCLQDLKRKWTKNVHLYLNELADQLVMVRLRGTHADT